MKRIGRIGLAVALSLAVIAVLAIPASAAVLGGGAVSGTVTLTNSGCIPVATAAPGPTTYTFNEVVLQGAFSDGSHNFAGSIDVANVKGGSPAENTIQGSGSVNSQTDKATFTGNDGTGAPPNRTVGTFYGSFQRVGSIVIVTLQAQITLKGTTTAQNTPIRLAANFTPAAGQTGIINSICSATFNGGFATV